jgi:hypothetical protein
VEHTCQRPHPPTESVNTCWWRNPGHTGSGSKRSCLTCYWLSPRQPSPTSHHYHTFYALVATTPMPTSLSAADVRSRPAGKDEAGLTVVHAHSTQLCKDTKVGIISWCSLPPKVVYCDGRLSWTPGLNLDVDPAPSSTASVLFKTLEPRFRSILPLHTPPCPGPATLSTERWTPPPWWRVFCTSVPVTLHSISALTPSTSTSKLQKHHHHHCQPAASSTGTIPAKEHPAQMVIMPP